MFGTSRLDADRDRIGGIRARAARSDRADEERSRNRTGPRVVGDDDVARTKRGRRDESVEEEVDAGRTLLDAESEREVVRARGVGAENEDELGRRDSRVENREAGGEARLLWRVVDSRPRARRPGRRRERAEHLGGRADRRDARLVRRGAFAEERVLAAVIDEHEIAAREGRSREGLFARAKEIFGVRVASAVREIDEQVVGAAIGRRRAEEETSLRDVREEAIGRLDRGGPSARARAGGARSRDRGRDA